MSDTNETCDAPHGAAHNDDGGAWGESYCLVLAIPGRDLAYLYQGDSHARYSAAVRAAVAVRCPAGSALRSHETAPGKGSTSSYLSDGSRWVKAVACPLCTAATFPADIEGDGICRMCHTGAYVPPPPVTRERAKLRAKHDARYLDEVPGAVDDGPRVRLAWERRAS